MDFGTLPPESSSGQMHSGPGPGSLAHAAKAWAALAAHLNDVAAGYRSLISTLALGWQGVSARVTLQAVAPYIAWLDVTAAQARHTAIQANAAASAYGSALAAMVAPNVIVANRLQRISLAEMNDLGQISVAIADIDADYERMWVQDAVAMYAYARASADATKLTPFGSPPLSSDPIQPARQGALAVQTRRNWPLMAAPEITSAGYRVMSTIPSALGSLSNSPLTTLAASLSSVTAPLSKLTSLTAPANFALSHLNSLNKAAALSEAAAMWSLCPGLGRTNDVAPHVSFGSGASIGALSVPRAWGQSTPRPEGLDPKPGQVDRSQ
ncbi:PPE family protein [Mycobacterium sp. Aquia_216]|uniref:PPE family protein n=1 Tax=Mycobacterium sp. Aquia_216 TaxID=2991729 RepID=UPI00227C5F1D|nr:PPE family protein [Mycobacterium sp. Aquia_216]WAJ46689.1 PPE family protein [Mycobacterium sp. Aquia_216]